MQGLVTRNHNKALVLLAVYTLTIFIYKDFDIPNNLGYFFLVVSSFFIVFRDEGTFKVNTITTSFAVLMFFQIVEITRSIMMGNKSQQMYIAAFSLIIFFVFVADSSAKDVFLTVRLWKAIAIGLSAYVVAVSVMPSLYINLINPLLSESSQKVNIAYLDGGYGVAVGGNIIIIDYIVAFIFLYYVCSFLIMRDRGVEYQVKCIIPAVFILIALFLINRKTELLAALLTSACMFFSKTSFRYLKQRRKNLRLFFLLFLILILGIIILYNTGHLGRYGDFLEAIITNKKTGASKDISSGRLILWEAAFIAFKQQPFFGIGWGMFAQHVPPYMQLNQIKGIHNVHNCYLQVLCESGIVGFLIFYGCMTLIIVTVAKRSVIISKSAFSHTLLAVNTTCVAYQLFFIICGTIDPTFYSIVFWLLYSLTIMMSNSVWRLFLLHEKDKVLL